jgi:hypothetical protein
MKVPSAGFARHQDGQLSPGSSADLCEDAIARFAAPRLFAQLLKSEVRAPLRIPQRMTVNHQYRPMHFPEHILFLHVLAFKQFLCIGDHYALCTMGWVIICFVVVRAGQSFQRALC